MLWRGFIFLSSAMVLKFSMDIKLRPRAQNEELSPGKLRLTSKAPLFFMMFPFFRSRTLSTDEMKCREKWFWE